jgi:hypothetical protein
MLNRDVSGIVEKLGPNGFYYTILNLSKSIESLDKSVTSYALYIFIGAIAFMVSIIFFMPDLFIILFIVGLSTLISTDSTSKIKS